MRSREDDDDALAAADDPDADADADDANEADLCSVCDEKMGGREWLVSVSWAR